MKNFPTMLNNVLHILRLTLFISLILLVTLSICAVFKYAFINSCIGQACPNKVADITGPLVAVGGLIFTALALIPIFWVENKVKAATEEVRRQVIQDVQQDIVKLVNAQLLVFRVHYESQAGQLLADERLIQDAVSLWPDVKKQEYPLLGERFARIALELNAGAVSNKATLSPHVPPFSDAPFPSTTLYPSPTFYPIDLETAVQKAIFYLEASRAEQIAASRELLFHLACMYGFYPDRYEAMIRCIEQAIRIDNNVKDDFTHYQALAMLSRSCNREQRKLERIGSKIGVELPLKKSGFLKVIQTMDEASHDFYLQWYAIKKTIGLSSNPFYFIKFSIQGKDGEIKATTGRYYQELSENPNRKPGQFLSDDEPPIALEELYDRIDALFYLISFKNE